MATKLLDEADRVFSLYIRARDGWVCQLCGSTFKIQNGHYFGRTNKSTRFDPLNCFAICEICNNYQETNPEPARLYLISRIGLDAYNDLEARHNTITQYRDYQLLDLIDHYRHLIQALN